MKQAFALSWQTVVSMVGPMYLLAAVISLCKFYLFYYLGPRSFDEYVSLLVGEPDRAIFLITPFVIMTVLLAIGFVLIAAWALLRSLFLRDV